MEMVVGGMMSSFFEVCKRACKTISSHCVQIP